MTERDTIFKYRYGVPVYRTGILNIIYPKLDKLRDFKLNKV